MYRQHEGRDGGSVQINQNSRASVLLGIFRRGRRERDVLLHGSMTEETSGISGACTRRLDNDNISPGLQRAIIYSRNVILRESKRLGILIFRAIYIYSTQA